MLWKPFYGREFFAPFPDGDGGGGGGGDGSGGGSDGDGNGSGAGGSGAGNGSGEGGEGKANGEPGDFKPISSQADFDAMIAERLKRHEKGVADRVARETEERLTKAAAEESAKKNGEFEKLYQSSQTKISDLEQKIKDSERATLVAKVAAKYKLPDLLAARLQGDTEADIDADAKKLAPHVSQDAAQGADNEGGRRNNGDGKKKPTAPTHRFGGSRPLVAWPGSEPAKSEGA